MSEAIVTLVGLSGSGKSAVGRLLAERLGWPFVDTDQRLASRFGRPVGTLLREIGEEAFRQAEAEVVRECLSAPPPLVVSTGGGVVTGPAAGELRRVRTLWLDVSPELAMERIARSAEERPLLAGDSLARLREQWQARRHRYAAVAERRFDGSEAKERLVREIARYLTETSRPAREVIQGTLLDELEWFAPPGRALWLASEHVARLWPRLPVDVLVEDRESRKRLDQVEQLAEELARRSITRQSVLGAVGGGVTTDVVGFLASIYNRGVPWLAVPTTLLGMIDASIGGKTGVDLAAGKNLLGRFHPPLWTLVDPAFLATLPETERRNGFAEAVKYAVLAGGDFPELVETAWYDPSALPELIARSIALKWSVVEADPEESGPRMLLNLGHTVGHGIEAAMGFTIPHGEAVAIGLATIGRWAASHGKFQGLGRLLMLLETVGLPTTAEVDRERCLEAMTRDKKRQDEGIWLTVPHGFGNVVLERHDISVLSELLDHVGG